jgi:hypothetical protein
MVTRRVRRDLSAALDRLREVQTELMALAVPECRREELGSSVRVDTHPVLVPLAHFHPRRGKLDQCLDNICHDAPSSMRVPDTFPGVVRFPIIARVKEGHATEKRG